MLLVSQLENKMSHPILRPITDDVGMQIIDEYSCEYVSWSVVIKMLLNSHSLATDVRR
jgi:hypothetical protein